jgi:hypothetical protein
MTLVSTHSKSTGTVQYVRTVQNHSIKRPLYCTVRELVMPVRDVAPTILLQLWSALNPDPSGPPMRPLRDPESYCRTLVLAARLGRLRVPPKVARLRRDLARQDRREIAKRRRIEREFALKPCDVSRIHSPEKSEVIRARLAEVVKRLSVSGASRGP